MISQNMVDAFNDQINAELYSSYLYLSMAAWLEEANLPGFTNWMKCQAVEELTHATKMFGYVSERGGRVLLTAIDAPPADWDSPLAVMEAVYEHEQKVTGLINKLVDLAIAESDHAANNFLQWFVSEQVEEEASANEYVSKLRLLGDHPGGGLFMLDSEMATRKFNLPANAPFGVLDPQ